MNYMKLNFFAIFFIIIVFLACDFKKEPKNDTQSIEGQLNNLKTKQTNVDQLSIQDSESKRELEIIEELTKKDSKDLSISEIPKKTIETSIDEKKISKKSIENIEIKDETLDKPSKIPSLDQLKKDLRANRYSLPENSKIDFIANEKSDPYSKPLIPQEIDRIKEKAKGYEPKPVLSDDIVVIETNRGEIKLKLFPDIAPKHCYNFKKLANSGYYDGTTFHRVIPNFMVQGGDILSRDGSKKNDGQGGPGWTVEAEFNDIKHTKGILSMARSSDPNSAGSQFFICHADAPHLNGKYTAFGKVIENLNVIDDIANAPTEYSETKKICLNSIPSGEDENNWIELLDPKTRKKLYLKVPIGAKKSTFKYEMSSKLRNDNPLYSVRIFKIRVD